MVLLAWSKSRIAGNFGNQSFFVGLKLVSCVPHLLSSIAAALKQLKGRSEHLMRRKAVQLRQLNPQLAMFHLYVCVCTSD